MELLQQSRVGRVVITLDAMPAVRTVRFAVAENHVVFRAAPDSRLLRATENAIVAFHADDYNEAERQGWSVTVLGHAKQASDPALIHHLQSLPLESWAAAGVKDSFIQIALTEVTGEQVCW
jgi:uncharacterized protein